MFDLQKLRFERLDPKHERPSQFECSDKDLNEFFFEDSIKWGEQLLSVTYLFYYENVPVCYFSVSNDALRKEELSNSRFKFLTRLIPHTKRFKTMPAVKIGRLATHKDWEGKGIGSIVIDFLKSWFVNANKTGCRFIIVDAYNNGETLGFYKKNNFEFLLTNDVKDKTRLMVFDLSTFNG